MNETFTPLSYLVASVCFIVALQALSSPKHARRGIAIGAFGMLVAVVGTLIVTEILTYKWIVPGLILGSLIGAAMSIWIPMTKMPERIALSHAFGGLAAALVGVAEYTHLGSDISTLHHGRPRPRGLLRLPDLHRQPHGLRQAAGADHRRAGDLPGAERHEHRDVRRRARAARAGGPRSESLGALLSDGLRRPRRRGARGAADRRRRHAGGDLAAQLVRRPRRRGHRLRARQLRADHRRRARRHLGLPAVDDDEQGDEPLVRQRAVRRVRHRRRRRRRRSGLARRRGRVVQPGLGRGGGADPRRLAVADRGAGLRHGGLAGPARRARARERCSRPAARR